MVALVLFCFGIVIGVINGIAGYFGNNDNKTAVTAVPFFLLAGAAVARYLGM
ncbi:MAG: hypothetical protein WBK28_03330 [Minisyncoccia bacterium]